MRRQSVTICNKLGMHARAAAKFVQLASRFECEIKVQRGEKEVNGKSIMGVMMLAAGNGTDIEILAAGGDAQQAVTELTRLVQDRFGESE
ncbi:MAG: HPr family phosphocarrier protein [Chromatiales bacterium]